MLIPGSDSAPNISPFMGALKIPPLPLYVYLSLQDTSLCVHVYCTFLTPYLSMLSR